MKVPDRINTVDVRTIRPWLNALRDAVKANVINGDQQNTMVSRSPSGSTVTLKKKNVTKKSGAGDSLRLARITAKTDTWTYTADIYSNPDDDAIEDDATIKVNTDQLASGETIPTGALLEVRKQDHGDPAVSYWTVIGLPRSL